MNLTNNELFVEFLAVHQPKLIKQWHAENGVAALMRMEQENAIEPPSFDEVIESFIYAISGSHLAEKHDLPSIEEFLELWHEVKETCVVMSGGE